MVTEINCNCEGLLPMTTFFFFFFLLSFLSDNEDPQCSGRESVKCSKCKMQCNIVTPVELELLSHYLQCKWKMLELKYSHKCDLFTGL